MYKGHSPKKAHQLIKDFNKKGGTQKILLAGEENEDAILRAQEAYGEVVRIEDDEGRLRTLRKKQLRK